MENIRIVRQNDEGGWDVLKEGHRRTAVQAETQSKAIARARELTRREGGGTVRVLNSAGKIVDTRTVGAPAPRRRAVA